LTEIYNGVERAAREQGWSVVVSTSDYRVETEREQVQRLLGAGIEAVVLVPVTRTRLQLRDDYLTREFRGAPLVLVDSAYPEQGHSQVLFDNYGAGQALTRHLISRGHRRIAFVDTLSDDGEPMMHRSTRDRHRGYVQALRGAGLEVRPEDIWSAARIRPEPSPATDLLLSTLRQAAERPTAVLALDDSNALDLIHAAAAQGIRVPNDLAVVGFDNTRAGRSVRPPFPTTDPDFRRAGELAVDLVLRTLSGELTTPVTYLLPVPLIRLPGEGDCVSGRDGLQRSPGERSDHGSRYNPGME
jgi:LacI family transcriptional regulator